MGKLLVAVFFAIFATVLGHIRQPRLNQYRLPGKWYPQAPLASYSSPGGYKSLARALSLSYGRVSALGTIYACPAASGTVIQSQPGPGCFIVPNTPGPIPVLAPGIPAPPVPLPPVIQTGEYSGGPNLVELASILGASTLVNFAMMTGLAETVAGGGPFTVFAPTNAAFDALSPADRAMLSTNTAMLRRVLQFHVLRGPLLSNQLSDELTLPSLAPMLEIRINIYGRNIATATGSRVIAVDNFASNGVIHVIDRVMFPLPVGTLPEVSSTFPQLSTLVRLVDSAELREAFSAPGPFTGFGPTNDAFNRLPPDYLNRLFTDRNAATEFLNYHAVMDTIYTAGLTSGPLTTLQGQDVIITRFPGVIRVNRATITIADIPASNGVLHIIDEVLLPSDLSMLM